MAAAVFPVAAPAYKSLRREQIRISSPSPIFFQSSSSSSSYPSLQFLPLSLAAAPRITRKHSTIVACLPPSSPQPNTSSRTSTKLFVSGLSFRTTEEGLRNAFEKFGQLVEVNLVMDRVANRPRGFAFLRYSTEEESKKAIEGMHGQFLDGRVIFVEVAKPRSELRQGFKENPRQ